MEKPRILGLDIGSKRTGVAISDEQQRISLPQGLIEASDKLTWIRKLEDILAEGEVGQILVGLPLNQHGEEGKDARGIREFIALLRERVKLPVIEWDERFTTVQAERALITADVSRKKRKGAVDQMAATILLQSYLDSLHFKKLPEWEDEF